MRSRHSADCILGHLSDELCPELARRTVAERLVRMHAVVTRGDRLGGDYRRHPQLRYSRPDDRKRRAPLWLGRQVAEAHRMDNGSPYTAGEPLLWPGTSGWFPARHRSRVPNRTAWLKLSSKPSNGITRGSAQSPTRPACCVSSILGSNIEILRDALDLVRPKKRLLRATSPVRDGTP